MNYEKITLSEKYSVYKTNYNWEFSKEDIVKKIEQSLSYVKPFESQTYPIMFQCNEFNSVYNSVLNLSKEVTQIQSEIWAIWSWIYVMDNTNKIERYHTHDGLKTDLYPIHNELTYCFYAQIPENLSGDEGKISFKTEDDITHNFLPKEGEIYLFSPTLLHTPKLTPNSEKKRYTIAGNIAFNIKKFEGKGLVG